MALKIYSYVEEELKLKFKKVWGLVSRFTELVEEKLIRLQFYLPMLSIMNRVKKHLKVSKICVTVFNLKRMLWAMKQQSLEIILVKTVSIKYKIGLLVFLSGVSEFRLFY